MRRLDETLEYNGPQTFSGAIIAAQADLFGQRAALFYTPTEHFPEEWIGEGRLEITLPIVVPTYHEFYEIRSYQSPRLWVDLVQRATGKLRWRPFEEANLTIIRRDYAEHPYSAQIGAKALVDALKVKTHGRADRRVLYYFGAIVDDGPRYMREWEFRQEIVDSPAQACTVVIVEPSN